MGSGERAGERTSSNGREHMSQLGNERVSNSTSANHTYFHRCLVVAMGAVLLVGSKLGTDT
jgi:pantothenate kinase type III